MGKLKSGRPGIYHPKAAPLPRGKRPIPHRSPFPTYEEVLAIAAKTSCPPRGIAGGIEPLAARGSSYRAQNLRSASGSVEGMI
jgi:hypothetical protein